MFVSLFIPTYNRFDDLMITLRQLAPMIDNESELIIFDQSDAYDPRSHQAEIAKVLNGLDAKYYHCKYPSVPLAWNSARELAKGDVLLFLDDDIDVDSNIIDAHRYYYKNDQSLVGVAGGYHPGTFSCTWLPSGSNGYARTFAGVNVSFKASVLAGGGAASSFIKPFAGVDWELAEFLRENYGEIAIGEKAIVFHRAPKDGGCGNQGVRDFEWYYGCYFNHTLWILLRKFPKNFTMLPRHIYWILKYCVPKQRMLRNRKFWAFSVFKAIKDAYLTYTKDGKVRKSDSALDLEPKTCIYDSKIVRKVR